MSSNIVNKVAFLRSSREFPEEMSQLTVEVGKMYIDVSTAVNERTIGLFAVNKPAQTGNSYFLRNNNKQATLRQAYTFIATTAIDHGIIGTTPGQFINCFGSYTDGTNTYGLVFGTSVAVAGQISFYVTPTQIVFSVGAGAPALTSGVIVLEWLSQT